MLKAPLVPIPPFFLLKWALKTPHAGGVMHSVHRGQASAALCPKAVSDQVSTEAGEHWGKHSWEREWAD
jgi:hypothetical protein